jgi:hypothetical protein
VKARDLKETIARLESQIEENNIRLRRTRRMVRVVTEHLRSTPEIIKPSEGPKP